MIFTPSASLGHQPSHSCRDPGRRPEIKSWAGWMFKLLDLLYLLLWSILYFFILRGSTSVLSSTLKMVGVWLLFTFIIPAGVHQWVTMEKPANLMTDFIDASRDKRQAVYALSDSARQVQLEAILPAVMNTSSAKDSIKSIVARGNSNIVLVNDLLKKSIAPIEAENQERNALVKVSYLFNPVTFFQNQFNHITETHFDNYQQYRKEIQQRIDQQIESMTLDYWNEVKIDKSKFQAYYGALD